MKTILFKPFEKYSEKQILIAGILLTSVGLLLASNFDATFDGALDVHFISGITFRMIMSDFLIVNVILIAMLYIAAKIVNNKTRLIDIASVTILSRSILYILSIFNVNGGMVLIESKLLKLKSEKSEMILSALSSGDLVFLIISGFFSIMMVIWYVALLFNGYKIASNAKGSKSIVLFIIGLLLAEVVSKVLIYIIHKL